MAAALLSVSAGDGDSFRKAYHIDSWGQVGMTYTCPKHLVASHRHVFLLCLIRTSWDFQPLSCNYFCPDFSGVRQRIRIRTHILQSSEADIANIVP